MFLKKILLQGLDPNLRGYQAALALYKRSRAATQKGMPFCFFFPWARALKRIWNKGIEKYLKEYLLFSQLWGTVQHTIDNVVVSFNWKNNAPVFKILSHTKTHPPPLKCWSMHVHHHVVIWDLKFCMPSSVRWTMAPSHMIYLFLLLFFSITLYRKF